MVKGGLYSLRVKGDKAVIENRLNSIGGVSSTTASSAGDGWFSVRVTAEGGNELGETLYKCAVDNGWVLSELKRESASLEDVFTQLTRG
jgi:hypothetical protein